MKPTPRRSWLFAAAIVPLAFVLVLGGTNAVALDGDGVPAATEFQAGTDPLATDTDGDGLGDGTEFGAGSDPLRADTDDDRLDDGRERDLGTDPTAEDSDGDGLTDGGEVRRGTDPLAIDSDADGLDDATEVRGSTHPARADPDGDDLLDGRELEVGTHPFLPDTDRDGVLDGAEVQGETRDGIALPDADPLRMDLYVQFDHVAGTTGVSAAGTRRIEDHFAAMPVENPDGSTGIVLHVRRGGAIDGPGSYTGDNYDAIEDASRRARGDRRRLYHGVVVTPFDESVGSVGFGDTPGDFLIVDADESATDRESIVVHETLHNVAGDLEASPGRCEDDPAHYCDGGWLEPSLGGDFGAFLPEPVAEELEANGFES